MRIIIKLSPTKEIVQYNYNEILTGILHGWIGSNEIHDNISMYSFSNLSGAISTKQGLKYQGGARWMISAYDIDIIRKIDNAITKNKSFAFGMKVIGKSFINAPDFSHTDRFVVATPVLVKKNIDGNLKHLRFDSPDASAILTSTLKNKMKVAGMPDEDITVRFDTDYLKAKTKLITYKGIANRCNVCPVIIKGSSEAKAFAWDVGIGHSTGIGFGMLK